jgi:hypothetical protein
LETVGTLALPAERLFALLIDQYVRLVSLLLGPLFQT